MGRHTTRRVLVTSLAAVLGIAAVASSAGSASASVAPAQPAPAEAPAQVPADNVFPIPAPYEVSFSDSWHACRDGCERQHKGNDLMADEGTPVVAVESGTIVRASATERGLGGITLWLLGDSGVAYYYAHNAENLVGEGQRVARGQMIARVGRTGNARSTAPHVHFQVNRCGETSSDEPCTVDPHPYLQAWAQGLVDGGGDGIGWYQPSTGSFGRRNEAGSALPAFSVGKPRSGVVPVAGDWDGDGRDSVGLYSRADATFSLVDDEGEPLADLPFGEPGRADVWPIAGDFDGDGRDTVGLYRQAEAQFVVMVDDKAESAPVTLGEPGRADALPVVGDWDGDGRDSVGVHFRSDGSVIRLDDAGEPLPAAAATAHGPHVFPLAGDWNGDGREEIGVVRRRALEADLPVPTPDDPDAVRTVELEGGDDLLPVAGDWNGRELVTLEELRLLFGPIADDEKVADGLPALNAAMMQAGINTPARKAAFLATIRSESAFRFDAVEAGNDGRYRGRGFIQLTGEFNYRAAGEHLGLDLVDEPDLAINGLVSPVVAAWYWTVARDINVAADALDMAAVNIAVGFAPSTRRDMVRCGDFLTALRYFSGEDPSDEVNCERTARSRLLAFSSIVPLPFGDRPATPGSVTLPPGAVPDGWTAPTTPSTAPDDPATGPAPAPPARPQTTTTRPAPPPSSQPPSSQPPSSGPTTSPPSSPTTAPSTTSDPTTSTTGRGTTTAPSGSSTTAPPPTSSSTSSSSSSSTTTTSGTTTTSTSVVPDSTTTTELFAQTDP